MSDTASTPHVVIVIPCYRQAEFLPEAVASVCAQTYRDLEIVIVDDGSPDDTAVVAERLAAAHTRRAIRLLCQPNQGLSASRNNGIAESSAECALVLDADDLIGPTFVEDCVRVLDARPDISIAYGTQRYFGEISEYPPMPEYDLGQLTRTNLFPCTALFRRRAWADVGGYDERLTSYEDWDFWLGCGERGHFGLYVPHSVFYYRKRRDSMLANAYKRDKHLKAQLVLYHPVLFSREQAAWARGVLEGNAQALGVHAPLVVIPALGETATRGCRSGGAVDRARRFATLAVADEILERPRLLAAYCAVFNDDDDASLVICGTHEQLALLGTLVEMLGLDGRKAADLLGVTVDDIPSNIVLAATKVDALLTLRPLRLPVPLPRVDEVRVHELRRLAQ
jgi:GT2 family glycosyltransferase